jgi:hypothetical protein
MFQVSERGSIGIAWAVLIDTTSAVIARAISTVFISALRKIHAEEVQK